MTPERHFQRGFNDAERGVPALSQDQDYLRGYAAYAEYKEYLQSTDLDDCDQAAISNTQPERHRHV